jgi:hypothetical protein
MFVEWPCIWYINILRIFVDDNCVFITLCPSNCFLHFYFPLAVYFKLSITYLFGDRLCGLVVILGYRSGGPGSIPSTTRKKSSGPGTGSTQPR